MKKILAVAALALAATLALPATAANADPLPPGGIIDVGDARWQVDEWGIAYGWDVANVYGSGGYIYYPGWYYDNSSGLFCPDPATNATVTYESNGDVSIDCVAFAVPGYTDLFVTFHMRLFAEAAGGYLARVWVNVDNQDDTDVSIANLSSWLEVEYVDVGTFSFLTSSGSTSAPAPDDSWFIAGSSSGDSVIWTGAWAKTGNTAGGPLAVYGDPASDLYVDFSGVTIPANGTANFLQFTHMVIPASQDDAGGAAALSAANAQVSEFNEFCGRLVEGLDFAAEYTGWGVPGACPLPATGPDATSIAAMSLGAIGVTALGVILLFARRRATA